MAWGVAGCHEALDTVRRAADTSLRETAATPSTARAEATWQSTPPGKPEEAMDELLRDGATPSGGATFYFTIGR
jgi:hypothetical protein